ncbi:MAG: hypothetical protein WA777_12720 [Rhodanobacter sp.]
MPFFQELAPGDTLMVGHDTRITLVAKSGQRARLKIDSDADIERIKSGDPIPETKPQAAAPVAASNEVQRPFLQRSVSPA